MFAKYYIIYNKFVYRVNIMKDIIIRINENMEKLSDAVKQINDLLVLENKLLSERFKRGSNDSISK
jgi:hypothetical protein